MDSRILPAGAAWLPLSKGRFAIVDADRLPELLNHKWASSERARGGPYAVASMGFGRKGRKNVYLHRYLVSAQPGQAVDHVNGDPLDNRVCNLRFCSSNQNSQNSRKRRGSKSAFKGVSFNYKNGPTKKWECRVQNGGKVVFRAGFATEIEAAKAYDDAARKIFGDFAQLNFAMGCNL